LKGGVIKRHNIIWQLQIAVKDTPALQTPPNVKKDSFLSFQFGSSKYHANSWYEVWANRLNNVPESDKYPRKYRHKTFWYWLGVSTLPFFPY